VNVIPILDEINGKSSGHRRRGGHRWPWTGGCCVFSPTLGAQKHHVSQPFSGKHTGHYWTLLDQLGQNLKWFWNFWKGFSQLILESSFKIVVVSCCFICYVHSSKRWSISAKKVGCHKNLQPFTLAWNPNVARILPKSSNALWLHRIFRRMLMSPLKNNRTPHKPQDSPK